MLNAAMTFAQTQQTKSPYTTNIPKPLLLLLHCIASIYLSYRFDQFTNTHTNTAIKRAHHTIQQRRTRTRGARGTRADGDDTRAISFAAYHNVSTKHTHTAIQTHRQTNERYVETHDSDQIHVLILMALRDTERLWRYGATQSSSPIIPTKHSPDGRIFAAS